MQQKDMAVSDVRDENDARMRWTYLTDVRRVAEKKAKELMFHVLVRQLARFLDVGAVVIARKFAQGCQRRMRKDFASGKMTHDV